jgi:hypothetical protein
MGKMASHKTGTPEMRADDPNHKISLPHRRPSGAMRRMPDFNHHDGHKSISKEKPRACLIHVLHDQAILSTKAGEKSAAARARLGRFKS